jgi:hypothetical protein
VNPSLEIMKVCEDEDENEEECSLSEAIIRLNPT